MYDAYIWCIYIYTSIIISKVKIFSRFRKNKERKVNTWNARASNTTEKKVQAVNQFLNEGMNEHELRALKKMASQCHSSHSDGMCSRGLE